MAAPLIEIKGMKETRKAMKATEGALKDLSAAHKRLGEHAAEDIKAAVPQKSGKWAGSIKGRGTRTTAKVEWGRNTVPYAGWQEFGGVVKWRGSGGVRPRGPFSWGYRSRQTMYIKLPVVREGRYVYPTAERNQEKYLEVYNDYVGEVLHRYGIDLGRMGT